MSTPPATDDSAPRQPIEKPSSERDGAEQQKDGEACWDVVDEASWESFPASDPPAYLRGKTERDGRQKT